MTSSNSTYPQEWIAQDSIRMQSELARQVNNNCEIGTFGQYTVQMSLDDLRQIANKELLKENKRLQKDIKKFNKALNDLAGEWHHMRNQLIAVNKENDILIAALQKYANGKCYEPSEFDGMEELPISWLAKKTLKELKK